MGRGGGGKAAAAGNSSVNKGGMDAVDSRQQVDLDRFIAHCQELQAR